MRKLKDEQGMVIIEATIVFPVMFLVIFLMIFMGNAYFEKCKVDAIVTKMTTDGAAYCATPMLYDVEKNGKIPDFCPDIEPYRYFTDMSSVKEEVEKELNKRLGNISTGLFTGMKPTNSIASINFDNKFIYSTFSIDLTYRIPVPIKLLGAKEFFSVNVASHSEAAVTDTPEFIRNVNMVEDYMEQTGAKEKIDEVIQKAKEKFKK